MAEEDRKMPKIQNPNDIIVQKKYYLENQRGWVPKEEWIKQQPWYLNIPEAREIVKKEQERKLARRIYAKTRYDEMKLAAGYEKNSKGRWVRPKEDTHPFKDKL